MPSISFAVRLIPAAAAALFCAGAAGAAPLGIDLGPANGYSAFIFGQVGNSANSGFRDVEGRLAAGGDVFLSGFSVGQKSPAGAPVLVAGGNLKIGTGNIANGGAVYGNKLTTKQWFAPGTFVKGAPIDFAAAKTQLSTLSNSVAQLKSTGTVVIENSGYTLVGDKNADVNVFNIDSSSLQNLTLDISSLKSTAHIIINDSATSIKLSGGYASFSAFGERTLFNFSAATSASLTTYAWGSILAPLAQFSGSGHLEGSLVADSVMAIGQGHSSVEIGALGFKGVSVSAVPEPASYAMLLAGLGLMGLVLRRRKAA
ncbi:MULTISPECIES: choice-of-anchor A family protein [unclassified Janthinobacterium]|uniref:choice-of-anchor A family protein n=1 Tax=unclassified Janthinobacterium TaxID=2610881 RepID=UPI00034D3981|nr:MULTISPECIES: choice-of-anchor A family protein [unclassified Janthinobacterium]MEC5161873.1 choice-of-anchor A domain-containing protein [Janthinobacterium sp. CG_S6]